jgi:hypothetical protein
MRGRSSAKDASRWHASRWESVRAESRSTGCLHRVLHQPATLSTHRRARPRTGKRGAPAAIDSLESWTWSRVSPGPGCRRRKSMSEGG